MVRSYPIKSDNVNNPRTPGTIQIITPADIRNCYRQPLAFLKPRNAYSMIR